MNLNFNVVFIKTIKRALNWLLHGAIELFLLAPRSLVNNDKVSIFLLLPLFRTVDRNQPVYLLSINTNEYIGLTRRMNPSTIVTLGTIRSEDSGADRKATALRHLHFLQRNPSIRLSGHVWG